MNDTERHRIPAGGSLDLIPSPRISFFNQGLPRECPVVTSHTYPARLYCPLSGYPNRPVAEFDRCDPDAIAM